MIITAFSQTRRGKGTLKGSVKILVPISLTLRCLQGFFLFCRRRLGAFDASASLDGNGVGFSFPAIFLLFFLRKLFSFFKFISFFRIFFISSPFISFYFELFISFLSGIFSYEFIVFSLSFFFLSLFASESETERQKKDFDEWNSFPSIIFHPLALSWFLSPRENPYPLRTDGFTSH